MSTPRCQICHCRYGVDKIPYVLQPCSHGMCKTCVDEYVVQRSNTTCPTCRQTILRHSVNYDLKTMCVEPLDGWKLKFKKCLNKHTDIRVTIDDVILPAVPMIICRLEMNRNSLYDALTTLVRNCSPEDVYNWVDALQFPHDWDLDIHVRRMLRHHEFLEERSAGWLLELL